MKITFHGAARTVTGSKHLIELKNGTKILLDCGLFQGMGKDTFDWNSEWGFDPKTIDYLILSHAHVDHSGLIPKLVKDGFKGEIYCTIPTLDLLKFLLPDSGRIQESDTKYYNKVREVNAKKPYNPLYTEDDAYKALGLFTACEYDIVYQLMEGVEFQFTNVGHIIGSASVTLSITEQNKTKTICFSGDIGRYNDLLLQSPKPFPKQADYLILESTYGDRKHQDAKTSSQALLEQIQKTCVHQQGKLIIPAFSVGRTQELLYILNQLNEAGVLPDVPVFLDSPLSINVTQMLKKHWSFFNKNVQKTLQSDSDPFGFPNLKYITDLEASKQLNYLTTPAIIISASGMADAGRVKHHIANTIENSHNTILLVGYCEPNSLGGRLKLNPQEITIYGLPYQVNATIAEINSMSAHADYDGIMNFISNQDLKAVETIFLVHGNIEAQQHFRTKLLHKGAFVVEIPERHQTFQL